MALFQIKAVNRDGETIVEAYSITDMVKNDKDLVVA